MGVIPRRALCLSAPVFPAGGRRAQGLRIVPDARVAIGISVTRDTLSLSAADLCLRELARRALPVAALSGSGSAGALADAVESFIDEISLDRGRLLGVGIAASGLWDISPEELTCAFSCPVRLENPGSASGRAECFVRGGSRNMAFLSLDHGISGAVLMDGELCAGDSGRCGTFGHICVEPGVS